MNNRDYMSAWVLPEGAEYRRAVYERQRAGGTKPLVDNPTVEEIRDALLMHTCIGGEVLEVGCGWGRLLVGLDPWFVMGGCDVATEMIEEIPLPQRVSTFTLDIARPKPSWNTSVWDCVFCRGVMMFIPPDKMLQAMRNMEAMARTKVLVWEWTTVVDLMKKTYQSDKFEYHNIPVRDE